VNEYGGAEPSVGAYRLRQARWRPGRPGRLGRLRRPGRPVIAEASGLALLAALSPTALLVTAVYLGSAQPRRTSLFYLAGAVTMSVAVAVVFLAVLRGAGLSLPSHRAIRYDVRIGFGVLLLVAAGAVAVRKPRQPDPAKARQGIVSRMIANPAPLTAYLVGVIIFGPSLAFLAAVQVIATARASLGLTATALTVVVAIAVLLVWLPLVLYLFAQDLTMRHLVRLNGWLRAHATTIIVAVLAAAGVILVVNGSYGLITG
jgi:hypothetical protein